jgi:hypothetical protein
MKKYMDVFPAILKIAPPGSITDINSFTLRGDAPKGTRRLDRCRAVYMGETLRVVVDSPEGPKMVFQEKVFEHLNEKKTHWIRTESGKVFVIEKDNNCGCGSRLRSWNPYGNHIYSNQDPE